MTDTLPGTEVQDQLEPQDQPAEDTDTDDIQLECGCHCQECHDDGDCAPEQHDCPSCGTSYGSEDDAETCCPDPECPVCGATWATEDGAETCCQDDYGDDPDDDDDDNDDDNDDDDAATPAVTLAIVGREYRLTQVATRSDGGSIYDLANATRVRVMNRDADDAQCAAVREDGTLGPAYWVAHRFLVPVPEQAAMPMPTPEEISRIGVGTIIGLPRYQRAQGYGPIARITEARYPYVWPNRDGLTHEVWVAEVIGGDQAGSTIHVYCDEWYDSGCPMATVESLAEETTRLRDALTSAQRAATANAQALRDRDAVEAQIRAEAAAEMLAFKRRVADAAMAAARAHNLCSVVERTLETMDVPTAWPVPFDITIRIDWPRALRNGRTQPDTGEVLTALHDLVNPAMSNTGTEAWRAAQERIRSITEVTD